MKKKTITTSKRAQWRNRAANNQLSSSYNYSGKHNIDTFFLLISYSSTHFSENQFSDFDTLLKAINPAMQNWIIVKGVANTQMISQVGEYCGLNRLEIQDILNSQHPAKIEHHTSHTFIVLNEYLLQEDELIAEHLSVCMKSNLIVTFQETETVFFHDIYDALVSDKVNIRSRKMDSLLMIILNSTIMNYIYQLRRLNEELEGLESLLLESDETKELRVILQKLRREYTMIKQNVLLLNDDLAQLLLSDTHFVEASCRPLLNDVHDHLKYALQLIDNCRDGMKTISEMMISNNDLRMNSIMQRLTVVSTIFIPLTFMAGIWGMNFKNMPELDWRYGYPVALATMIVSAVVLWYFFSRRKWF